MCLLPDVIAEKVTDLTPEFLKSRKIKFLMLDFDNTLVPYTVNTPTSEVLRWLDGLKRAKIGLCVVSNSRKDRVKVFCKQQNIPAAMFGATSDRSLIHAPNEHLTISSYIEDIKIIAAVMNQMALED